MSLPSETASRPSGADLLDCSRYGEVDDVESILSGGVDANHKDAHGNTALHLSCANGHADVVRALIKGGASHLPNGAGNRPLQWAVQNKHVGCVKALLELYPESSQMNVLDKNGFGKSALTDAFKTGEADMVTMVLNHKSAEEDMLLSQSSLSKTKRQAKDKAAAAEAAAAGGGAGVAAAGGEAAIVSADGSETTKTATTRTDGAEREQEQEEKGEEGEEPSITHELGFALDVAGVSSGAGDAHANGSDAHGDGSGSGGQEEKGENGASPKLSVLLRELPIRNPDECFGDDAREDTTGLNLWAAAIVLGRWMTSPTAQAMLEGKTVLELGAGCGAGGISAAVHGRPASVLLTDLNVETMRNLAHNIELNRHRYPAASEVRAVTLDWGDESTWDAAAPPVDVVLAADVVYQATQTSPLIHAIHSLLKPGGTFLHVSPTSERDGLEGFLDSIGGVSSGGEGGGGGCGLSGFELVSVSDAPPEYVQNPLISGSEEDCILHFTELPSATFRLHEFRKLA